MVTLLDRFRGMARLLAVVAALVLVACAPGRVVIEHICSMTQEAGCACAHEADDDDDDGCCSVRVSDASSDQASVPSHPEVPQAKVVALAPSTPDVLPVRPLRARLLPTAPPRGPPRVAGRHPDLFVQHCTWLI